MFELEPCPFCGKQPKTRVTVKRGVSQDFIAVQVICLECDIKKEAVIESGLLFACILEAERKAREAWNRRANDA